ncbi:MAG: hypothetical protein IJ011_04640 [Clostridia bacterium]|nr:hypothetical protein [Clostridia bacterium]
MKKVISIAIILCMLASAIVVLPMTASAAYVAPASWDSIDDLFDTSSNTGLDAYYGTPDIPENTVVDGKEQFGSADLSNLETIKDAAWDKALMLTLDNATGAFINNSGLNADSDIDVYLLWDNENLYILEDVRKIYTKDETETIAAAQGTFADNAPPANYKGWQSNMYNIVLPRAIDNLDDTNLRAKGFMIFVVPCLYDPALAETDIYEGVVRVRDHEYSSTTSASGSKSVPSFADTYADGLRTWIEKTDTGYMAETVIPWSYLDSTSGDAFANLADKTGQTIGMKISHNNAYHINQGNLAKENSTSTVNADAIGFDPVTLLAEADPVEFEGSLAATEITPDIAYWLDKTTGQFITKNPTSGGQTYEIATAAQLFGLSEILESLTYNETTYGLSEFGFKDKHEKPQKLTQNNTFVLTADIDLNPGVTDWNGVKNLVESGDDFEIAKIRNNVPFFNIWKSLDAFYGTFDGQGHTISGIYNPSAASGGSGGGTDDWGGLVGSLRNGGIKNVVIASGYVADNNGGGFGGIIGTIYVRSGATAADSGSTDKTATIVLENIYVGEDFTANASAKTESQSGGLIGGSYANGATQVTKVNVNMTNIVFNGTFVEASSLVCGDMIGYIRHLCSSVTFKFTMTDVIVKKATGDLYGKVEGTATGTETRVSLVESTVPEANAPYWVATTEGVMTAQFADKLSKSYHQTSEAVAETGVEAPRNLYNIRILAEVDSTAWKNVGFKVTIVDKTNNTKIEKDNVDNAIVYSSVLAAGETKTAADLGIVDGDYIATITLNGLDASHEYEISYTVVYTDAEGNVFESLEAKTIAPTAYVPAA